MFARLLFVVRSTTFTVTLRLFTVKPVLARSFHFSIYSWNFVQEPLALFSWVWTRHTTRTTVIFLFSLIHHFSLTPCDLLITCDSSTRYLAPCPFLFTPRSLRFTRTPLHVAPHACSIFCNVTPTPKIRFSASLCVASLLHTTASFQHLNAEKEKKNCHAIPRTALQHSLQNHYAKRTAKPSYHGCARDRNVCKDLPSVGSRHGSQGLVCFGSCGVC